MSFVVSFNGQFKKYELPDISRYDRKIHKLHDHGIAHEIHDKDEKQQAEKRKNPRAITALKKFQQHEKDISHKSVRQVHAYEIMSYPVHTAKKEDSYKKLLNTFENIILDTFPF
jgi:hypothetical protein